ncbi:type II/IV secretion system ATPase subunit [uncultured Methanomethylovorans sp.]|uniref:type II/IV secretion system ATPase subunit n=1 Tax=uncultured Methanomethylovorans sp. TaxID=183759 RepID=UPI002AA7B352|nr:type II/IV secretion system ATPase subunit [uncultured Methanomethylovorans sp.]
MAEVRVKLKEKDALDLEKDSEMEEYLAEIEEFARTHRPIPEEEEIKSEEALSSQDSDESIVLDKSYFTLDEVPQSIEGPEQKKGFMGKISGKKKKEDAEKKAAREEERKKKREERQERRKNRDKIDKKDKTPPEIAEVIEDGLAESIIVPDKPGKKTKSKKKKKERPQKAKKKDAKPSKLNETIEKIKQAISPVIDYVEELPFEVGDVRVPIPGVPQRKVNITYLVKAPFQYVHVEYMGEELRYTCVEPPMSSGEQQNLMIVENAFDKMAHSEILLVAEEDRAAALRDRFDLILEIYKMKLTDPQKEKFFYYLFKKYMGFGKIDILMNDPYIEDVTCNGPYSSIYVNHRVYGSVVTDVVFEEIELNNFVMRIAQAAGRHISVLQPIRDATLTDGSRANLTLGKEVTKKGSTFTIRRFRSNPVSCIDLIKYNTFDATVLAYFWLMVEYKRSILAAGGTASGKTTTLNALGVFIPHEYKIVSIEDTAEMNLMHPNWTQSITRTGFGGSGEGNIDLYDLLKAALRQRPEYIVVGEVRGAEAGTLFQAISVGHPCMGTIHAGSIHELVSRVESEPMNVPRNLFASLDLVIFNAMIKVGEHFLRRALRIVEIVELDPERGDLITNPIFKWDPVSDTYEFSGSSSMFADISEEFGIDSDSLTREMYQRAEFLAGLARDGITDYRDVARAIRRYSKNKDAQMEEVQA